MKSPSTAAALSRVLGPLRRSVLRATRAAAELPDLPDTHIEVLRAVADSPAITPKMLAGQLGLARPTVSNLIQSMRRAELLTLDRDDDDARVVHVSTTDYAAGLLRRYDNASEQIVHAAMNTLTPAERAAITAALPALARLQTVLAARADEDFGPLKIETSGGNR